MRSLLELIQDIKTHTQEKIPETDSTAYLYYSIDEIIEKLETSNLHNLPFWDKTQVSRKLQVILGILSTDNEVIDEDKIDKIIDLINEVLDEINNQMEILERTSSQNGGRKKKSIRHNSKRKTRKYTNKRKRNNIKTHKRMRTRARGRK